MRSNLFAENRWTNRSNFTVLFSGIEESPRDVVLLVKPCMGSEELAQVPEVCFPFVGLNYLEEIPDSAKLLPQEPSLNGTVINSCELRNW